MRACPEADVLVTVAAAVDWSEDDLQHLVGCAACRESRVVLRATRAALSAEHAVPTGFPDRILKSLQSLPQGPKAGSRFVGALLLPIVVGLTSLAAILASAGPVPVRIGPALGAAALLALATAARELRAAFATRAA